MEDLTEWAVNYKPKKYGTIRLESLMYYFIIVIFTLFIIWVITIVSDKYNNSINDFDVLVHHVPQIEDGEMEGAEGTEGNILVPENSDDDEIVYMEVPTYD